MLEREGSAPGTVGESFLLVDESGAFYGTVGGGLTEHRAIEHGRKLCREKCGDIRWLELSMESKEGAVCGGRVRMGWYYLDPEEEQVRCFACAGLKAESEAGAYWMGFPKELPGEGTSQGLLPRIGQGELPPEDGMLHVKRNHEGVVYCIGGGHVALETVPLLCHLGFRCVVVEDRPEMAAPQRFPEAEAVYCCEYHRLNEVLCVNSRDSFVIFTSGHLGDRAALGCALRTPAGFVGCIGSKTKAAVVREYLQEDGFSQRDLERVISPLGLPIGSRTPAEIAVSIAAQLIAVRAQKFQNGSSDKGNEMPIPYV